MRNIIPRRAISRGVAVAVVVAATSLPVLMLSGVAGAATNAEVESQANIGINDWINATSDAYYGYFSIAKIEYKTGLGYEEDLQSETGSSLLARELWSGLFNPLQPIIESWVLDERPAPSSLQSYMSSSEYEIAVNDAGM
jgi:hypothetical protein